MKKIVIVLLLACFGMGAKAQFPTMDSLRNFTNRYIRNSAVEAFQNLRLNTVLNGLSRFGDSSIKKIYKFNDSTFKYVTTKNDTFSVVIRGAGGSGGGSGTVTSVSATDKTGISWSISNGTTTPNLDLSIYLNRMVKDSVVLATPVANFYSLPANSTIVVFRALTANTGVDITTTGGVNSGTTARAGKPFIVANQDSVYKLVLSPYAISDSGNVTEVAPRSWVMIVPIATQWYKVAGGSFSQVNGEAYITPGSTTQYWRGDKTWQTLDKSAVGLGNVPNVDATNASNISTGTLPSGRYGATSIPISAINATGTPSGSTVLKGDGSWGTVTSGGSSPVYYGSLYNKNSWTGITDFTNNGTINSIVSNKIQISGGNGALDFTESLDINGNSMLENWSVTSKIKVDEKTSTSYGFGLGVRSITGTAHNTVVKFDATTTGGAISIYSSPSNTLLATSSSSLTFSVGDYILIQIEKHGNVLTASAYNYTTNSSKITVLYNYIMNTSNPLMNNTGKYAIYSFGGQFTVDSVSVYSRDIKNADILVVGDSKTQGYDASDYGYSWPNILRSKYPNLTINAGQSDRLVEILTRTSEIIALKPKIVLLAAGSNDIRGGRTTAQYFADYDTITNRLTAAGIRVVHLLPFYETAISQTNLVDHINATFSQNDIIDTYSPMLVSGSLNGSIHPSLLGHQYIASAILNSGKISGYTSPTIPTGSLPFGSKYGGLIAGTNFLYDQDNLQLSLGGKVRLGTNSAGYGVLTLRGGLISTSNNETLLQFGNDLYIGRPTGGAFYVRENGTTQFTIAAGGSATFSSGLTVGSTILANGGIGFPNNFLAYWGSTTSVANIAASGVSGSSNMKFTVNSVERIRVNNSGNVSFSNGVYLGSVTTEPNSTLQVAGSVSNNTSATATSLTLGASNYTVIVTATGQTITLPTAIGITGRIYVIKLTASGTCTVATTSSQTIDGSTTYSLSTQYKYVTVQSDGANWVIIGNN